MEMTTTFWMIAIGIYLIVAILLAVLMKGFSKKAKEKESLKWLGGIYWEGVLIVAAVITFAVMSEIKHML